MNESNIIARMNKATNNTLMETLGIQFLEATPNKVIASMPVGPKVYQPDGLLHGGASVALAETVGSFASFLSIDPEKQAVRGLEISANHVRGKRDGEIIATATPIHKGRTTHIWEIKITDESDKLISHCKLTTIIIDKK